LKKKIKKFGFANFQYLRKNFDKINKIGAFAKFSTCAQKIKHKIKKIWSCPNLQNVPKNFKKI
jgi:hypothetical protein